MPISTKELLPGTEVRLRGLRWEVVSSQSLGPQVLLRLRGLENAVLGRELDVLFPFEDDLEPVIHDVRPEALARVRRRAPIRVRAVNWRFLTPGNQRANDAPRVTTLGGLVPTGSRR